VRVVALVVVLAWPLAAAAPLDTGRDWRHFRNRVAGHELRVPPGWRAYIRHSVTLLSSRPLTNPLHPHDLGHGEVYLRIDQHPSRRFVGDDAPRPAHFDELPPKGDYGCGLGAGHRLAFVDHGYHFRAFVRLGAWTSGREALAILNSLRVTK
jgi:hypothetical protein